MPLEVKSPSGSLQKLMGLASSILRRRFNPSKCKTEANLVSARIKLLRNRREMQVRQMRRDIAMLLQSGQEDTARIRVEHVIREQNTMAANEVINLFCELIVVRLPIIQKQRDCPPDLKEAISSVIYAAPRCSDIPELCRIRDIFEKKYGKDFVTAAADLRPESGVNRLLIEKLSIRKPAGEVKLKVMEEIAKEFKIQWDATETKNELLKPPEELLEGPRTFISASSFPIKPNIPAKELQQNEPILSEAAAAQAAAPQLAQQTSNGSRGGSSNSTGSTTKDYGRRLSSQGFHVAGHMKNEEEDAAEINNEKIQGRNSYHGHRVCGAIKFDDSDGLDSENEIEFPGGSQNTSGSHEPPESHCSVNSLPRVHPKLPDYEKLAARFEALKLRKS